MTHLHITTWAIAIILFVVVVMMLRKGVNSKAAKINHMVLRVFYILIVLTGADLYFRYYSDLSSNFFVAESIVKVIAGIWVIAAMEMVAVKLKKGKPAFSAWLQFAFALILTVALGFGRLPYGILP
ncbi:hypothetical protein CEY16_00745 [Halalkalibacillus sediminis]|uniref:UPF0344 protein CEY16_00745 n=1 Tax=Halalkalibacillus sediminis TaxID=2018042 RepID=A0A2I0QVK3_9BACI|nr:YisL family protein [Halalkalibacillus sediminis]PKR78319.1 hypothetical protein CEY16_00745 [Halalkalibacillus sediminis]